MLCSKYEKLDHIQRNELTGSIIHCIMNDDFSFEVAQMIIEAAKKKGLFQSVKIGHQIGEEEKQEIIYTPAGPDSTIGDTARRWDLEDR